MDRPDRPTRLEGVTTCPWLERVSEAVDGESSEAARAAALAHARQCSRCAVLMSTTTQPHVEAVTNFGSSPALPMSPVDPEQLTDDERRWLSSRWSRRLLIVIALVIVAEAVPSYINGGHSSAETHAARHLAAWQIGFGVGLFIAAWFSRLSQAMLAFAATFAALTIISTLIDIVGGHPGPWAEPVHVVELVGVFLLWRLTPPHLLPWRPARPLRRSRTGRRVPSAPPGLRVVRSDFDRGEDPDQDRDP